MSYKTKTTKMLINLLLFCAFMGSVAGGMLLPESVASSQTVSINPLMPNDEQSVRDCPFTYYPYAYKGLASSVFAEPFRDKTFDHVVKLETDDKSCVGVIVDQMHVLSTKECAMKEPKTISFRDESLSHWDVDTTTYHPSFGVALLRLKPSLNITSKVTPACLWNAPTSSGFPDLQHITRDHNAGSLNSDAIECRLTERSQCFKKAKNVERGFLQLEAVSNFRMHPFIVAFGIEEDGSVLEVSKYADWIQQETGSSVEAIDCTLRYYKLRNYDNRIVKSRNDGVQTASFTNSYIASSKINHNKVSIGHYMEDPVKETIITYSCYGTLIDRQYVLTAASCVHDLQEHSLVVRMNEVKTYVLPSSDPDYLVVEQSQFLNEANVARVYIHPSFSKDPLKNDIALLLLDPTEFSFDQEFRPACLWAQDTTKINEFQTNGHGPARTVEYLEDRTELLQKDRRETELLLISKVLQDCPLELTPNQMCVGDAVTIVPGTCESNPGSAMSRELGVFDQYYYNYVFAISNKGENCGYNTPSTFTKVSPYIKWIDSIVFGENVKYNDSNVYYGDECSVNGKSGVCLTIEECPGISNQLMNGNKASVAKISCGFENDESIICCSTANSLNSGISSDLQEDIEQEIENCPELYTDFRKGRSPYNLRTGTATYVGVLKSESSNDNCDVTLISKRFLVTSVSCYKKLSQTDTLTVLIGQNQTQQSTVEKVFLHPKFETDYLMNNIAVLKLKTPFTINQEVIPACLWKSRSHVPFLLEVTGTQEGVFEIPAYALYQAKCEKEKFMNLSTSELCASYDRSFGREKSMICHDAGTGIYNYFAHGLYETLVSYLVGIYNRGTVCEENGVGVFTRISHHFGWIKSVVYRYT